MRDYKNNTNKKIFYISFSFIFISLILPSLVSAHNEDIMHKNIQNLNDPLLTKNLEKIHRNCIYFIKGEKYILIKDHMMSNPNPIIFKNKLKGGLK
jgi:hypothetical protein